MNLIFNNKSGNLIYEGALMKGLYHGYGKLWDDEHNCPVFNGQFQEGKFRSG